MLQYMQHRSLRKWKKIVRFEKYIFRFEIWISHNRAKAELCASFTFSAPPPRPRIQDTTLLELSASVLAGGEHLPEYRTQNIEFAWTLGIFACRKSIKLPGSG